MAKVVQIVRDSNNEVVWQSRPLDERSAEKAERGAGINLNWEEFYTRVVKAPKDAEDNSIQT